MENETPKKSSGAKIAIITIIVLVVLSVPCILLGKKLVEKKETNKEELVIESEKLVPLINKIDYGKKYKENNTGYYYLENQSETTTGIEFKGEWVNAFISLNDNIFKIDITTQETKENVFSKTIENAKKVYFDWHDCNSYLNVFVLTNDGTIYSLDPEAGTFEIISQNTKYEEIGSVFLGSASCDAYFVYLGKTTDGKYYNILTSEEFNKDYCYYEDTKGIIMPMHIKNTIKVLTKGDVYINNQKIDYKLKLKISMVDDDVSYFITEDNYLYDVQKNGLYNNTKIKKVYYNEFKRVNKIEFEDGSTWPQEDDF